MKLIFNLTSVIIILFCFFPVSADSLDSSSGIDILETVTETVVVTETTETNSDLDTELLSHIEYYLSLIFALLTVTITFVAVWFIVAKVFYGGI